MKSPVRIACVCLIVNALSGLVLMQFWGATGLAAGNIFSAGVQAFLLMNGLKASGFSCHCTIVSVAKIGSSAIGMALVCYLGVEFSEGLPLEPKIHALLSVSTLVPLGGLSFFLILLCTRARETELLKAFFKRKLGGRLGSKSPD